MEEKGIPFIRFVSAAALLLLGACVVLLSWVPPVSRDALVHHLALPKLFLRHGILADFPTMVYSYYPMNLDLLYMIPLRFGNDIAPKLIHFSFGLLTAWVLYAYLKSRLGRTYGLMAALFFLSTPVIVKLSTTVYVDLGVIFFSTAALLLLLQWAERRFRSRYLLLSAVCCGLALGTKYNALICLLLLTFLASVLRVRRLLERRWVGCALSHGGPAPVFTVDDKELHLEKQPPPPAVQGMVHRRRGRCGPGGGGANQGERAPLRVLHLPESGLRGKRLGHSAFAFADFFPGSRRGSPVF
ncbi:MAG: glycosyltransferase family 39 protein [Deltaproteobacteria bacterium]|nr:glycosyltransferase family 39 protein [Deltaproteobacteria bacterium]